METPLSLEDDDADSFASMDDSSLESQSRCSSTQDDGFSLAMLFRFLEGVDFLVVLGFCFFIISVSLGSCLASGLVSSSFCLETIGRRLRMVLAPSLGVMRVTMLKFC